MPIFGGEKPFTSVTVKVNQLCTPNRNSDLGDDSMEIYLEQLISLIKLQSTGPAEAARAIRKKIKYGNNADEMLLASNLLELMVLNAGPKIGRSIAGDEKLGDLLKGIVSGNASTGAGTAYDPAVIRRFRNLAIGWRSEFRDLDGYKPLANLWRSVPRKSKKVVPETEVSDFSEPVRSPPSVRSPPPRPSAASPYTVQNNNSARLEERGQRRERKEGSKSKNKRTGRSGRSGKRGGSKGKYADEEFRIPQINYKVEAPKIRATIANCHTHTTALSNILLTLPEGVSPLDDQKAADEFEKCRKIRRSVLRYLQFVGAGQSSAKSAEVVELDDEFLGALIVANDQLVNVFTKFDRLCGYTDENPAAYHNDENINGNEDSESSAESYYSESDEESISDRLEDLHVQETSSRLAQAIDSPSQRLASEDTGESTPEYLDPGVHMRPPAMRQNTGFSVNTADSDPFGDKNAT